MNYSILINGTLYRSNIDTFFEAYGYVDMYIKSKYPDVEPIDLTDTGDYRVKVSNDIITIREDFE